MHIPHLFLVHWSFGCFNFGCNGHSVALNLGAILGATPGAPGGGGVTCNNAAISVECHAAAFRFCWCQLSSYQSGKTAARLLVKYTSA